MPSKYYLILKTETVPYSNSLNIIFKNILLYFPANIPTRKRESSSIKEIHGLKMLPSFQEE